MNPDFSASPDSRTKNIFVIVLLKNYNYNRVLGPHSTEVAFALLTQWPLVRIPAPLLSSWTVEIEAI